MRLLESLRVLEFAAVLFSVVVTLVFPVITPALIMQALRLRSPRLATAAAVLTATYVGWMAVLWGAADIKWRYILGYTFFLPIVGLLIALIGVWQNRER